MTAGRPGVGEDEFLKNFHPGLLFVEEVTKMTLFLSYELPNRFLSIKSFNNGNSLLSDFKPKGQLFEAGFKLQIADSCWSRPPDCGAVVIVPPKIAPVRLCLDPG